MTCVLDAVFAQASQQYESDTNPVLNVSLFASKTTPYDVPNSNDPKNPNASPPGTPIGGTGNGELTYDPQNTVLSVPLPSFTGEIQYLAGIFEGATKPPSSEEVSLTINILQLGNSGSGQYSVFLASTPSVLFGGTQVLNCTPAIGGPFELTGQFQAYAMGPTGMNTKRGAVPSDLYSLAFTVAMRTYLHIRPEPVPVRSRRV
jgi:hypothetical protein